MYVDLTHTSSFTCGHEYLPRRTEGVNLMWARLWGLNVGHWTADEGGRVAEQPGDRVIVAQSAASVRKNRCRHTISRRFRSNPLCSNVPTRVARPRPCHDRGRATRVVILHVKWGPQGQMGHTVSRRYAAGCYACRGATRRGARGWSDSRSRAEPEGLKGTDEKVPRDACAMAQ